MQSRYESQVDATDTNHSASLAVRLIGSGKRVLELGAASGHVTKVLREQGNHVTAVESDGRLEKALADVADEVVITDLNWLDLADLLAGKHFDIVLAGDVLEHCHDPDLVLHQSVGLLAPSGSIVISVPNIAHADVRLALLTGRFDYRDRGLLDRTHLRFFTRSSLEAMLVRNGLVAVEWQTTNQPVGLTEVGAASDFGSIPREAVDFVAGDPDSTVYQHVVRAVPALDVSRPARASLPSSPRDALLRSVTLEDALVRRGELLTRAEADNARLRAALAAFRTEADAEIEAVRRGHRREMAALRRTRWWRLGESLRVPRKVARRILRFAGELRSGTERRRPV